MRKLLIIQITKEIQLKEIELDDASNIFHLLDSQREYFRKWLPFVDGTHDIKDSEEFVLSVIESPEEKWNYVFVIHYQDVFVGLIGFKGTDKINKETEIGYWLSHDYQHKGIITESLKCLANFAFKDLGMHRIFIRCAVGNIQSKNIPKRLGFTLEGIERDGELLVDNVFTDIEVYSLLKKDHIAKNSL